MPVIVDTYNVLHVTGVLPPHLAGVDIAGLADLIALSRYGDQNVWLVCDGKPGPNRAELRGRIVTHYAGAGAEADDDIGRMIDASTTPKRLTVVSSDRRVAAMARRRRCRHRSSEAFLAELAADADRAGARAQRGARHAGVRPPVPLDRAIVDRWVALFALGSDHLSLPRATLQRAAERRELNASSPATAPPKGPSAAASPKRLSRPGATPAPELAPAPGAGRAPTSERIPATRSKKELRRAQRGARATDGAAARRPNDARNAAPSPTDAEARRVIAELERELPPELLGELHRLGESGESFGAAEEHRAMGGIPRATDADAGGRDRGSRRPQDDKRRVGKPPLLGGSSFDLEAFDFEEVMRAALESNPPPAGVKEPSGSTSRSGRRTASRAAAKATAKSAKHTKSSNRANSAERAKSTPEAGPLRSGDPSPNSSSTRKISRGRKGRRP